MTSAQVNAFSASTDGVTPAILLLLVASTLAIIYLLWLAWIAHSQFRSWQTGQGNFYDLLFTLIRSAVMALLLGFLIR